MGWQDLYTLSNKDRRSAPVLQRRLFREAQTVANTTLVTTVPALPADMAFELNLIACLLDAGAAQTCTRIGVFLLDEAGNTIANIARQDLSPYVQFSGFNLALSVVVMPGERLQIIALFSGAVANTMQATVAGMVFPRGTLQHR
jgi:hypothetical protein